MILWYSSSRLGFKVPDSKISLALLATFFSASFNDCFEMVRCPRRHSSCDFASSMQDHKVWIAVSTAAQLSMIISFLTYACTVQITVHINTQNSGDVFKILQNGLNQRQKATLVVPYAEMIDQRFFNFCVTPNGSITCPMEIVEQRVQVTWAQRKIPYDELYDLAKSGMHNSELLARFLGLCFIAK